MFLIGCYLDYILLSVDLRANTVWVPFMLSIALHINFFFLNSALKRIFNQYENKAFKIAKMKFSFGALNYKIVGFDALIFRSVCLVCLSVRLCPSLSLPRAIQVNLELKLFMQYLMFDLFATVQLYRCVASKMRINLYSRCE